MLRLTLIQTTSLCLHRFSKYKIIENRKSKIDVLPAERVKVVCSPNLKEHVTELLMNDQTAQNPCNTYYEYNRKISRLPRTVQVLLLRIDLHVTYDFVRNVICELGGVKGEV